MFAVSHDQPVQDTDGYCSNPSIQNKSVYETPSRIPSLKRKRADHSDTRVQPFDILPYPNVHLDLPIRAIPLFLLPRHLLSLSSINNKSSSSFLSKARFFSANVNVLESDAVDGPATCVNKLLLARIDHDGKLYAIERVRRGVYAICQLGDWVNIAKLKTQATKSHAGIRPFSRPSCTIAENGQWWTPLAVIEGSKPDPIPTKQQQADNALSGAMPATLTYNKTDKAQRRSSTPTASDSTPFPLSDSSLEKTPASVVTDDTSLLIQQYLETLYLSGTSLAYFAKGALSRARATHLEAGTLPLLAESLRSLVINVTLADKRYRETLPAVLKTSEELQDEDDVKAKEVRTKSRRRSKVAKRAKDGLLTGEDEVLVGWWTMQDSSVSATADFDSRLHARLPTLRFRETLLQLVLILEILSLEKPTADMPPAMKGTNATTDKDTPRVDTKLGSTTKKPKDLVSLAQSLVDRLMIWQSVEVVSGKSQRVREKSHSHDPPQSLLSSENTDKIRDFCIDTMIPFYGTRLPNVVNVLSEKMGMPIASPIRTKRADLDVSTKLAPGTAISRTPATASASARRRPLSRVSSETSRKASAMPPSLLRSATESNLHELKRERSSTPRLPPFPTGEPRTPSQDGHGPLENKQTKDPGRRSLSRANSVNQSSNSFGQREVDFSAITKYHEAKARKKDTVAKELKDAIATLKKPNRGLAVKDLAEEAEARNAKLPKVPNIAQRNAHLGVQVNATPKRSSKKRDAIAATPDRPGSFPGACDFESIPSSSAFIPSSTVRPANSSLLQHTSTQVLHTPSRSGRASHLIADSAVDAHTIAEHTPYRSVGLLDTKAHPQTSTTSFARPTKPGAPCSRSNHVQATILSTPVAALFKVSCPNTNTVLVPSKTKENLAVMHTALSPALEAPSGPPKSIYQSLGWDDDELM